MSGQNTNPLPPPPQQQAIAAPSGSSGGGWFRGMRGALLVCTALAFAGGIWWSWNKSGTREADRAASSSRVGAMVPYDAPAMPRDPAPVVPAANQAPPPPPPAAAPRLVLIPPEAYTATGRVGARNQAPVPQEAAPAPDPNSPEAALASRLQPAKFAARQAAPIPDPAWMIRPGTPINCVLDVAIDSTLDGIVVCIVTRDVYGSTGTIKLLPRGTQITGETRGGMKQGQRRLEVVASVAMTPDHRLIDIDSAMTDALGRTGVDGEVDTHLGERLTGALLMGIASDGVGAATSGLMGEVTGNTTVRVPGRAASGTDAAMAEAFRNSINIPPTLRKNQGEVVSITVARWLDFRPAYEARIR